MTRTRKRQLRITVAAAGHYYSQDVRNTVQNPFELRQIGQGDLSHGWFGHARIRGLVRTLFLNTH
jgi:hypothetical protein